MLALVTLVELRYHHWRITQTLPFELSMTSALVCSFYALELFTAYTKFKFRNVLAATRDRSSDAEANLRWYGSSQDAPLIDILIPTYNEGSAILRMTILAAAHQDYPRYRVWVLDDGRRSWLPELCSELNAHYLSRAERQGFKAGNLNHALECLRSQSEQPQYVAVLDADCVAYPAFLEQTLALMRDRRVAIVQTPQHFYNPDVFQYAFNAHAVWPEEWRAFSFEAESMDAKGAANCLGTAFLARVEALQAIGGFPTASLQEDKLLSRRLAKLGWRTVFLKTRLSVGRSVESLGDLLRQRWRWSAGGMQIFLEDWRAFGESPLLWIRLCWLRIVLGVLAVPAIRIAWLGVPTIYWFSGVSIVRASTEDVLSYCLPMLLAPHIALFWLSRGAVMPVASQAVSLLLAPQQIAAGLTALFGSRKLEFFVTPKGSERRGLRVYTTTLAWTAMMFVALVGGVLYRTVSPWADPSARAFLLWNGAATALFLTLLWVAMIPCIERPRCRKAERYSHRGRAVMRHGAVEQECVLHDLSVTGTRVSSPTEVPLGEHCRLALSESLDIRARIVRQSGPGEVGVEFLPTVAQETKLIRLILCSPAYVPQPQRWSWWRFCAVVARRSIGARAAPPVA